METLFLSVVWSVRSQPNIINDLFMSRGKHTQPSSEDIFYGGQLLKQPFILTNYKAYSSCCTLLQSRCSKRQNICYTQAWGRVFTFLLLMPHIHFCVGLSATASWTMQEVYTCAVKAMKMRKQYMPILANSNYCISGVSKKDRITA